MSNRRQISLGSELLRTLDDPAAPGFTFTPMRLSSSHSEEDLAEDFRMEHIR